MKPALISKKASDLDVALKFSEGEVSEEIQAMLVDLSKSVDDSVLFLKQAPHSLSYFKDLKKRADEKIKQIEAAVEFIEAELKKTCKAMGGLEGNQYAVKLKRTKPSVELEKGIELDDVYLRTKVTHEPDKEAIREALESNIKIPGARLVESFSLLTSEMPKQIEVKK